MADQLDSARTVPAGGAQPARTGAGPFAAVGITLGIGSVALLLAVGLAGPNAVALTVPGGRRALPPYALDLGWSAGLAVGLTSAAVLAAGLAVGCGLVALARGWLPDARRLLAGGAVASGLLVLVAPLASADVLVYAVYGRLAQLGLDPYTSTARTLVDRGDPIGLAAEEPWLDTTSVYGPLATAVQELAVRVSGGTMHGAVLPLVLVNAVAFVGTGLLLVRLAGSDPARRARAALLWGANPLMLYVLVAGAHLDAQAIALAVLALFLLPRRALLAGVVLGLAGAVKISIGLWGLAFLWALRHRPREALKLCLGAAGALAATYGFAGGAVFDQVRIASRFVSPSTFWHPVYERLDEALPREDAKRYIAMAAWVLIALLTVLLLRLLPHAADDPVAQAARTAAALSLAWVLGAAYVLPWYDATAWAMLAIVVPSVADWLLLVHTTAYGFWYVASRALAWPPGVADWASRRAPTLRTVSAGLVSVTVAWALARLVGRPRRRGPSDGPVPPPPPRVGSRPSA